ncbi:nitrate- and nitrite sensing domain-containing protein [Streptomyces evansiae]|uniref:nitrate- and nitrite sensing domain-containing protein n=1 Tax=Streptomyces evansiae TaxID=3075535 RepID=UPI0028839453|nr:nitrate- and nitrite sensing domain-containing protein [Streptomyces sp. DSM 41859]MDT0424613.1 nitrate- and nitrite sensing domain-containing protein [Streptomyces sp. DSM 41859]
MATARDQPIPGQVAGRDATRPGEDTPASAQDEPARDGAQDGQGVSASAAPALRIPGPRQPEGSVPPPAPPAGRRKRVRSRLVIAVAVVAAAVAGAGAPALADATDRAHEAQRLVDDAGVAQQSTALAQALADERDEVTSYIASGRPRGDGLSEQRSARVDRGVQELEAADIPKGLRDQLDAISGVRRQALTGKGTALAAHTSYSRIIDHLHARVALLADALPQDAAEAPHALVDLDTAVTEAGAVRGLLLAALAVPRPTGTETRVDPMTGIATTVPVSDPAGDRQRDALSRAAHEAQIRSEAALAAFRSTAREADLSAYTSTVTGADVNNAEKYLARLTDEPTLDDGDLGLKTSKVSAALGARIELMRSADAALAVDRSHRTEALRDDEVQSLELRVVLVGVLLLAAAGVGMATARSLTRPLAALRLGAKRLAEAEDPAAEEPVRFTGRNDEFAQVVHSVNVLHAHAVSLHERLGTLEGDRKHLVGQRQSVAADRDRLRAELAGVQEQLDLAKGSINGTFVNLALRTLGLVERQLGVIENLEEREQDPDRLATLFKLDHLATVMRRHSENLLVLAGAEHGVQNPNPVPLVDVLRAAVSEIERYERVRIAALPPHAHIAGFSADDLSHLVAELLENATSFSPPDAQVEVSAWLLENGEVMLSVQDEGIGMSAARLDEVNELLTSFQPGDTLGEEQEGLGLGLYVVARLSSRHGIRVRLREQKQGGIAAVVVLPPPILATPAAGVVTPHAGGHLAGPAPTVALPGSEAEANSNELPGREAAEPSASGTGTVASGTGQEAAAAGTGEDAPAAGTGQDAPAAGTGQDAPAAGTGQDAPAAGTEQRNPVAEDRVTPAAPGPDPLIAAAEASVAAAHGTEDAKPAGEAAPAASPPAASTPAEDVPAERPAPAKPAASGPGVAPAPTVEPSSETTMILHLPPAPGGEGTTGTDGTPPARDDAPAPKPEQRRPTTERPPVPEEAAPAPAEPAAPAEPVALQEPAAPQEPLAREEPPAAAASPASPYAIGPDAHARIPDTAEAEAAEAERVESWDRVTDKGLPKRTPKISAPAPAPRAATPGVDAEALRRRLGGFHQGATQGRKDVEAALAEESGSLTLPGTEDEEPARGSASARPGSTRPPAAPTTADAREVSAEGDSAEEERR